MRRCYAAAALLSTILLAACADEIVGPDRQEMVAQDGPALSADEDDENDEDDEDDDGENDRKRYRSESTIYTFDDMTPVGSSTLVRTRRVIRVRARTWGLEPGIVVTLWLAVFNHPENCTNPCDDDDIENLAAGPDALYAAGDLVGRKGIARFDGKVRVGDVSTSINPAFGLPAFGVQDAFKSELHLIVRTHGPAIPGLVKEMMRTYGAGCNDTPPELGTPGPNSCADIRFAVHSPPQVS